MTDEVPHRFLDGCVNRHMQKYKVFEIVDADLSSSSKTIDPHALSNFAKGAHEE